MNESLVSFIICTNNKPMMDICKIFLNNLIIPNGFDIEIIEITNALSMTSGYNRGMKEATGKYKVYLHQDLYICNPNFIQDIIDIFQDDTIGLIGLIGGKNVSNDATWYLSPPRFGSIFEIKFATMTPYIYDIPNNKFEEVSLVDGLLMATQYDIKWRDDIFDGWHYYDCSHCLEFIRANKKVVIPKQETPWSIHDCGINNMSYFEHYKKLFLKEYSDEIKLIQSKFNI